MISLNNEAQELFKEIELAKKYGLSIKNHHTKNNKYTSTIAFVYERARNAVEYRDEHLIRLSAIERILKRRLFLKQPSDKIANLLIKELTWARYIEPESINQTKKDKFKNIIEKYRDLEKLVDLCACEIDEILYFNPINQIVINFVSNTIEKIIDFDEENKTTKSVQIYIATERSFAKNSESLIKYKLLKVLLPNWTDNLKLQTTLQKIDEYLNYKDKDIIRRKVNELTPPFNLINDLVTNKEINLTLLGNNKENFEEKLKAILELKYLETKSKVLRASKRSLIYIFLTKMILAIIIEIPLDLLFGTLNYVALSINVLFPPSLMILFNSRIKLPDEDNTHAMLSKVNEYLYEDHKKIEKQYISRSDKRSAVDTIFFCIFIITSVFVLFGIIYLLNKLSFNFINQIIFLFFLSVVSFFAFRVQEISNDYLIENSESGSFFDILLDYIFLPIIKSGQWLSSQIAKVNILSFIFDVIIEAPLKTFLEILEQWLHFVRIKKEEFLR